MKRGSLLGGIALVLLLAIAGTIDAIRSTWTCRREHFPDSSETETGW